MSLLANLAALARGRFGPGQPGLPRVAAWADDPLPAPTLDQSGARSKVSQDDAKDRSAQSARDGPPSASNIERQARRVIAPPEQDDTPQTPESGVNPAMPKGSLDPPKRQTLPSTGPVPAALAVPSRTWIVPRPEGTGGPLHHHPALAAALAPLSMSPEMATQPPERPAEVPPQPTIKPTLLPLQPSPTPVLPDARPVAPPAPHPSPAHPAEPVAQGLSIGRIDVTVTAPPPPATPATPKTRPSRRAPGPSLSAQLRRAGIRRL